eukprot:3243543-Alexandrium_andersonii.AAC.1
MIGGVSGTRAHVRADRWTHARTRACTRARTHTHTHTHGSTCVRTGTHGVWLTQTRAPMHMLAHERVRRHGCKCESEQSRLHACTRAGASACVVKAWGNQPHFCIAAV